MKEFHTAKYHKAVLQRLREHMFEDSNPNSDFAKRSPFIGGIRYHNYCLELIQLGCLVQPHEQGIFVNNKFIICGQGKWRVNGAWTWYRYRGIENFVEKYVKKDARDYAYYKSFIGEEFES